MFLICSSVLPAQYGGPTTLKFEFQRDVLPGYVLSVANDGGNVYTVLPSGAEVGYTVRFNLNAADFKLLDQQAASLGSLPGGCGTRLKNIAKSGQKTLTYTVPEAVMRFHCSWNYSDNKTVALLGEELMGLAMTLETGRKLESDQRFDRLGLDKDMLTLLDEVKSGQAWGLEAIQPIFKAIVADQSLLERVRMRAQKLLEQSELTR